MSNRTIIEIAFFFLSIFQLLKAVKDKLKKTKQKKGSKMIIKTLYKQKQTTIQYNMNN